MLIRVGVEGIAVGVHRHRDIRMTEDPFQHLRRHTALDTARRIGMPETVEVDLSVDIRIDHIISFYQP